MPTLSFDLSFVVVFSLCVFDCSASAWATGRTDLGKFRLQLCDPQFAQIATLCVLCCFAFLFRSICALALFWITAFSLLLFCLCLLSRISLVASLLSLFCFVGVAGV